MKARITTLLSLTGVLVAGSAAALVNTQVLQGTSLHKSTASDISVEAASDPSSESSEVANKYAPLAPVVLASAVSTQSEFKVGDAGVVTLDTVGDVLTIVSTVPGTGWTVAASQNSDPLHIEITLQSATTLIEFKAGLATGQITTSVESKDLSSSTSTNTDRSVGGSKPTGGPPTTEHHSEPSDDNSEHSGKGGGGSDD